MITSASVLEAMSAWDIAAACWLILALLGSTWIVENPPKAMPSTHVLMGHYRQLWMHELAAREVRIFDAQVLSTLRQGVSFFASTTLIAIGASAALLGQTDQVADVASDLAAELGAPIVVWEIKILFVILLLTSAFLKFVWALRLYGYCAVVMSAVPSEADEGRAEAMAARAGRINNLADRSFTRGLRTVYFSLASLAWFLGPFALAAATFLTLGVVWRREFRSKTRTVLLSDI